MRFVRSVNGSDQTTADIRCFLCSGDDTPEVLGQATEALAEHGIGVELSCEQGVCGTCLIPVLDGAPDHRDRVQSADEKAGNWHVAACCSRSRSALLVLDV